MKKDEAAKIIADALAAFKDMNTPAANKVRIKLHGAAGIIASEWTEPEAKPAKK